MGEYKLNASTIPERSDPPPPRASIISATIVKWSPAVTPGKINE